METINHECYVSFEIAKLLKEAGFDWNTFYCYRNDTENIEMCHVAFNWNMNKKDYEKEGSDNIFHGFITSDAKGLVVDDFISAPTIEVTQRWLREVKGVYLDIDTHFNSAGVWFSYVINVLDSDAKFGTYSNCLGAGYSFNEYEESLKAGIKKALEIILDKGE